MLSKLHLKLLTVSTVAAIIFALLAPATVLADGGTPPTEVPAPEVETTPESASNETAPNTVIALDDGSTTKGVTEIPLFDVLPTIDLAQNQKSVADITQTLADTNAVLVDAGGNAISLVSEDAAEALSSSDPWFNVGGGVIVGYSTTGVCVPGVTECHTSATPIQAAVNDLRSGGTIIHVESGIFTEQIVIAKSLTLKGAGTATTTIQSPAILTPDSNGLRTIVSILGAGVNVDFGGFTVNGPTPSGFNSIYGIFVGSGATANIHDNAITNVRDNPFSGAQHGVAIGVGRNAIGSVGTATINNNIIEDYQKNGITVDGAGSSAIITNNTITGAGPTTTIGQNGVQISRGATGTIDGNTITGNNYTPASDSSTGILLYQAGNGVQVKNNTLGGTGSSANEINLYVYASNNVTITNNSISDSTADNVDLDTVNGGTITGNKVSNSGYDGISLVNVQNVSLTGNIFTDNANGAIAADDPNVGAIHLGKDANPVTITIFNNSFVGNKLGVSNQSNLPGYVDATNNWWGDAGGPNDASGVPDDCELILDNPGGSGNAVSQCVLYSPWLTANPFAAPIVPIPTIPGNDGEHGAPSETLTVIPPSTGIVPITGGQQTTINCDRASVTIQVGEDQITFTGLCSYDVVLDRMSRESLPGSLTADDKLVSGLKITLSKNGVPVETLPVGSNMLVSFAIPAGSMTDSMNVLDWTDPTWAKVSSSIVDGRVIHSMDIPGSCVLVTE